MFYKYRVKWGFEDDVPVNYGIGKADSFKEAMKQITNTFGEQEIFEANVEWISDADLLDIEELYHAYKKEEKTDASSSEIWEEVVEALNEAVMEAEDENEELEADNKA